MVFLVTLCTMSIYAFEFDDDDKFDRRLFRLEGNKYIPIYSNSLIQQGSKLKPSPVVSKDASYPPTARPKKAPGEAPNSPKVNSKEQTS